MKRNFGIVMSFIMIAACISGCGEKTEEIPAENTVPIYVIESADDLSGKTIGTQLGTTGFLFAQDIQDANVEPFSSGSEAIQALKVGDIDAVLIDAETANVLVQNEQALTILDEPFAVEEYSVAYAKDNEELGQKIDDAISKLKEDGTLEDIKKHWIGENADNAPYVPKADIERNGKMKVATNAEFPPYESFDENGNIIGIDVDIMNAVCDELGMELVIESVDFDTIIPSVNEGEYDAGAAGISVTPEREKNVSFTQPYATSTQVIVVHR
ncbi:MAG: transporter substrate-binding domain-containing protein [Ruminococcus sp.]|nr:transporter substrate-binding domain-containing protein [Ruminococcus sp.]